jgi:hypothetical protein
MRNPVDNTSLRRVGNRFAKPGKEDGELHSIADHCNG